MTAGRGYHEVAAIRRRHPSRDALEGLVYVIILFLLFRHFVVEVFKIPTGSMAPTLQGQHSDLTCPNCGNYFPVDSGSDETTGMVKTVQPVCQNCGYLFAEADFAGKFCSCFPASPKRFFWRGDNRVIVSKFVAEFQMPERYDIVVFRYPHPEYLCLACRTRYAVDPDTESTRCPECGSWLRIKQHKTFIKRLAGLPGDELSILQGDVHINGKIARKPAEIQKDIWQMVYDSRHVEKIPLPGYNPRWQAHEGEIHLDGPSMKLVPGESGEASVSYLPVPKDFAPYNGSMPGGFYPVGDLRWSGRVSTSAPGYVQFLVREDDDEYVALLGFGEGHSTTITRNGEVIATSDFSAGSEVAHSVSFANWDDTLLLTVDGEEVLMVDAPSMPEPENFANGLALGAVGTEANFEYIRIDRDIYYVQRGVDEFGRRGFYRIPDGHYFFLGDNTRNSSDSRYWGSVPEKNLVGRATVLWWPFDHFRAIP